MYIHICIYALKTLCNPIIIIIIFINTELLSFFIENNADVNIQDGKGYTPLIWAAGKGHELIVMHLLKHGAKIHALDRVKNNALMMAATKVNMFMCVNLYINTCI
jgi:ankyrin repeat protein